MVDQRAVAGIASAAVLGVVGGFVAGSMYGNKSSGDEAGKGLKKRGESPLWEYSVVYTDRAYNLMSTPFQQAMKDISSTLKKVYKCDTVAVIPGSGSYGMEAVARQFGTGKKVMVLRNGYFSFRWSDIFNCTKILSEKETVLYARAVAGQEKETNPQMGPIPIEEAVRAIKAEKPALVCAPHVETALGMLIPDDYIRALTDAVHSYGGIFCLDAIAAGAVWCDMQKTGVDVLVSAPQKGWTGPACSGLVMLNKRAADMVRSTDKQPESNSFCCNLQQWVDVMDKYENKDGKSPGFRYYTTLPTDALMTFSKVAKETEVYGWDKCKERAFALGKGVRAALAKNGYKSVAADEFAAPGVVVVYAKDGQSGLVGKFKQAGIQIAGGVPWKLNEMEKYNVNSKATTFRVGLFGLDKLQNVDACVARFENALQTVSKL